MRAEIYEVVVLFAIILMPPAGLLAVWYAKRWRENLARNDLQAAREAWQWSRIWAVIGVMVGLLCALLVVVVLANASS
ncbi:CD225/dispanin family protein [Frankia sp. AiPs1]|uniref:CD225/dispanin family protein n=1 Tax=Frankia sp. AiPs1 TaxID=573493 RepID=UPI002042E14C|nr:CD225/dispanin family protein [Frankia sp. AiPs1]MCM3921753.1 CD225/dispanin family protein [Frankia sp. AiPs1]